MRKEYTRLLMAVNDAKANVKEAVRLYHQRDRIVSTIFPFFATGPASVGAMISVLGRTAMPLRRSTSERASRPGCG